MSAYLRDFQPSFDAPRIGVYRGIQYRYIRGHYVVFFKSTRVEVDTFAEVRDEIDEYHEKTEADLDEIRDIIEKGGYLKCQRTDE